MIFSVISARIAVLFCAVILLFEVKESPASVKPDTSTSLGLVDVATGKPLGADVTKVIVLVHGYQPSLSADAYSEGDWKLLKDALVAALKNTDWHLAVYHWEGEAATGPLVPDGILHATEASNAADKLGVSLGTDLAKLRYLGNVHFISHSAGVWAVRSATQYLLAHIRDVGIQVTLLDPFVPGVMEKQLPRHSIVGLSSLKSRLTELFAVVPESMPLDKQAIDNLAKEPDYSLLKLENYYTRDFFVDPTAKPDKVINPEIGASLQGQKAATQTAPPAAAGITAVVFNWRNGDNQVDLSKAVEYISPGNVAGSTVSSIINIKAPMPIVSHGTSIVIYAQSVRGEGPLAKPNQATPVGWAASILETSKFENDY